MVDIMPENIRFKYASVKNSKWRKLMVNISPFGVHYYGFNAFEKNKYTK